MSKKIPNKYRSFTERQLEEFAENYIETGDVVTSLEKINPQLKKYGDSSIYNLGLKILSHEKTGEILNKTIRDKFIERGLNPDNKFFEVLEKAERIAEEKGDAKAMVQLANLYAKIVSSDEKRVNKEVEISGTGKFTPEELERIFDNQKVKLKVKMKEEA